MLAKAWAENEIQASARATDYEFLRRAYLDIIGRIATPGEVRSFEMNRNRAKLVHRLLYERIKIENHEFDYAEEYARNWANIWTVWLMTRSANPVFTRSRCASGWKSIFAKNRSHKEMVEKLFTATGKTNDNGAVNFILRHFGEANTSGKVNETVISTWCRSRRDHPVVFGSTDPMRAVSRPSVQPGLETAELLGRQRLLPAGGPGSRRPGPDAEHDGGAPRS